MAEKIQHIQKQERTEEEQREQDLREIEDALVENKEVILKSLFTLKHADDRGVISLLHGLFADGDKVLKVLADTLNNEENTKAIRHLLLLMGVAGKLDVEKVEPLLLKVNEGLRRVGEAGDTEEKTGYMDLVKSLKDPEVNRAVTLLLTFLKGMGQEVEEERKTGKTPPD
ncbi:DUF1641 domain-containing protein [Salibacterium halotolerans]|uniref:Uncharacterized conserved protein YjgD, DUF1641 family n=1 Tax=Salibacterium halotolerans TaxID=1884432 RepID=A0A1I5W318_9BACI|nr:DUF1641 domain-containing protein [Salibacterium halotolerans]SFQ14099.1 Uncharacterized conserved protein YjgD, DUF1641 family [Salibacterium halotolerans]